MTRIILLSFFIINTFQSFCQDTQLPADSLSKYSYSLLGFSNNPNADFGTCFFINHNNNLFLVTAKHTLYNCDTLTKKEYPAFKFGIVFIPDPFNAIQFSVPQTIDTCLGFERDTDLLVLKVDKRLLKMLIRLTISFCRHSLNWVRCRFLVKECEPIHHLLVLTNNIAYTYLVTLLKFTHQCQF